MSRNERTPRTLAETMYCTGYSSASYADDAARIERRAHAAMYLLAAVAAACAIAGYIVGV